MSPHLGNPDKYHVNAASGWLELGNWHEADDELEKVTPALRAHPEVLALRWRVYHAAKKHDVALEIATTWTRIDSNNPAAWVSLSISLYGLGKTREAFGTLSSQAEAFPDSWQLFYDLACYATQLDRLDVAEGMLHKAITLGDAKAIKLMALDDPDLEPLWKSDS